MFKCVECGGKTKVVQTRPEPGKIIRKIKCTECLCYFFTEEKFLKLTEESERRYYQDCAYNPPIDRKHRAEVQTKIQLQGARSDQERMIVMVQKCKPMTTEDWVKLQNKLGTDYTDEDSGMISPEV